MLLGNEATNAGKTKCDDSEWTKASLQDRVSDKIRQRFFVAGASRAQGEDPVDGMACCIQAIAPGT